MSATASEIPLHRFSAEQYYRMAELGILSPDERVELLDGLIIQKSRITPPHAYSVEVAREAIERLVPRGWAVRSQQPVSLPGSEPEPDLAIVRGVRRDYAQRHPRANEVGLLVEVADASLRLDRELKSTIYAAAAIPAYWILNLQERQLELHRDPQSPSGGRAAIYRSREIVAASGSVSFDLDGRLLGEISVSDLLPPE